MIYLQMKINQQYCFIKKIGPKPYVLIIYIFFDFDKYFLDIFNF